MIDKALLKSFAAVVLKSAPILGSAIGGPIGGIAVSLIANLFNANPEDTNDILSKMSVDPNAETKLKELEYQHLDTLRQYQSSDYKTEVDDRESAREREVEVMKITGKRDWMLDIIGIIVILGFFTLCLINYFFNLRDDHVMISMTSYAAGGFTLVLSYYFGSTRGQT